MKRVVRFAMLAAAALLGTSAHAEGHRNWSGAVAMAADGSHTMGSPAAKVKLTEYVSYTCPHCADFHNESYDPLRMAYVMPGKVSLTVKHVIRDPIDLAAALLTNCGDAKGFFVRHNAFLHGQETWLKKLDSFSDGQKARWQTGPTKARLQAIASDFGFYSIASRFGLSRVAADQCLADEALSRRIVGQTKDAVELGVTGTPSFAVDGALLADTYDWASLNSQLQARF